MQRYILIFAALMMLTALAALSPKAAMIGDRVFSAAELKKGFAAYLEYQKMPQNLSEADSLRLYEQYFDELIAVYIYNQAIQERGIEIGEEELQKEIFRNPPQALRQIPDFQSGGVFDAEKLEKALSEEPDFKEEVFGLSRDMALYRKLLDEIKAEVSLDTDSLKTQWLSQSRSAKAEIIYFDYSKYKEIVASKEEVEALYEKIKETELKKENGRSLYYVMFEGRSSRATASPATLDKTQMDSRALYNLAKEQGLEKAAKGLKYELKETLPFSRTDEIIRGIGREPGLVSQAFFYQPGMLLSPYTNMVGDIFILEVGPHHEVFYEDFKVIEAILQYRANSQKRAAQNRRDLEAFTQKYAPEEYFSAAAKEGISIVHQEDITLGSSFAPIGEVPALNQAILETPAGELSPLIESMGMFYIARVLHREVNREEDWEAIKDELYQKSLKEAQNRHLDDWFLGQKAKVPVQK